MVSRQYNNGRGFGVSLNKGVCQADMFCSDIVVENLYTEYTCYIR